MKTDVLKEQKLFDESIKEWEETMNTPRDSYLKNYVIEILKKIDKLIKNYGTVLVFLSKKI